MLGIAQNHIHTRPFIPAPQGAPEDWAAQVEALPGVLRFKDDTLSYLATLLARFKSDDHYMVCAAYHAFTGRNGLWAYARGKAMVLFARNPDNPAQIMFFPQLGEPFPLLALELMHRMPQPAGGYMFARYPAEQAEFIAAVMNRKSDHFSFEAVTETVLDWTYPVHTIATGDVVEAAGRRFKSFRQHLNTIDHATIEIKPLDPHRDIPELMGVIAPWAEAKADICPPEIMIDVYVSFLRVMQRSALNLQGVKFYMNGEPVAFEAWALPVAGSDTANSFAGFSKTKIRGFSEFQHYTICRILKARGVARICLGGSECEGLDSFKRKMNPVESIALKSIAVRSRI